MAIHTVIGFVVYRSDLELNCLQVPEGLLDMDQLAIVFDYFIYLHFFFGHIREDNITAVKLFLFTDLLFIERPGEDTIGYGREYEFADFVLVDDLSYPDPKVAILDFALSSGNLIQFDSHLLKYQAMIQALSSLDSN